MEVLGAIPNKVNILTLDGWKAPVPKSNYVRSQEAEDAALGGELQPIDITSLLSTLQQENVEPLTAANALQDVGEKNAEITKLLAKGSKLTYEDVQNSSDPEVAAAEFKRLTRIQEAANRLTNIIAASDDNFVNSVNGFLYDNLIEPVVTADTGLTGQGGQRTEFATDWQNALSLPDDEWAKYLDKVASDINNPGYIDSLQTPKQVALKSLAGLEAEGYVPGDKLESFFMSALSVADVAGAVAGVGKLAGLGKRPLTTAGRSVIARVAAARGTEDATAVATKLTAAPVTEAKIAEDIMPTALRAPEVPLPAPVRPAATPVANAPAKATSGSLRASTAIPPVSQGSLISNAVRNRYLEEFRIAENAGSFGKAGWTDDVATWAGTKANAMAHAAGSNVVNIGSVKNEMTGTFSTKATFGDLKGMPTSYTHAIKYSQKIPNSVVVDAATGLPATRPVKGRKYLVEAEMPVLPETGAASPVQDSLSVFGRFLSRNSIAGNWLGSANRGIARELNGLAFQSDYGATRMYNYVSGTLKEFGKLKGEELEALDNIFNTLSDSPRTTWLDQQEFINDYRAITGQAPRREVIQVYEMAVEASDASWYLKASEHLKAMNSKNTLMFDENGKGLWEQIYPDTSARSTIGKVRNAKSGAVVDVSTLDPDVIVYKYVEGTSGKVRHVYNVQGMTRLPKHTDALPYNAGGPRSNPHMQYFVGSIDTVDANTGEGKAWNTLFGSQTEKEAKAGVAQVNNIQKGFDTIKVKGIAFDPQNPYAGLTTAEGQALDDLVVTNNDWMPQIGNWKDYVEFVTARGVNIGEPIVFKPRNAKLLEFIDYQDDFLIHRNLDSYVQYKRHDLALMEYGGGKAWNPNPVQAIYKQLNQSVAYAARTQYRVEHVGRFMKTIDKYRDSKNTGEFLQLEGLGPYTPEVQIRHLKITGNSDLAVQLRREQSVILRRLGMYEGSVSENNIFGTIRGAWTENTDKLIEAIHGSTDNAWMKSKLAPGLRDARDGLGNAAMSLGFMTKMTSPSTFVVQASTAYQIMAVTPKNAMKASVLAGYVRRLAADKNAPILWDGLRGGMARMAGLTDNQLEALRQHFIDSGRGFARGAVIEDPEALPGIGKGLVGKATQTAGNVARMPFYAGENFAQTVSRIAAYFDTIDKFPNVALDSKQFWDEVAARDRALSLSMNKSSANMLQTDPITRFMTQFTSFQFRALETIFFETELTKMERLRLGLGMTVLWGAAGMGLGSAIDGEDGTNNGLGYGLMKYGPIDYMLKEYPGVTIGDRIGLNIPSLVARANIMESPENNPIPAVNIGASIHKNLWDGISNFVSGREQLGMYSLERLVRTFKVVNDEAMAYQMVMSGTRTTVSGTTLKANFTTSEAFMQAVGFAPAKVADMYALSTKGYKAYERSKEATKKATPSLKLAIELSNKGDIEGAYEAMEDAAAIVDWYGLPPTVRGQAIKDTMNAAGQDKMEMLLLSCIKAGCSLDAVNYLEGLK